MCKRISIEKISRVLKKALTSETIDGIDTSLVFYDLDRLFSCIDTLFKSFPSDTLHAIAIKANPVGAILRKLGNLGAGLEAASEAELHLALHSGISPDKILFDSPAKTVSELVSALNAGVRINADSLMELQRIHEIVSGKYFKAIPEIGLRINPQVGTGNISITSVSGRKSKFGVPLNENRNAIIESFEKHEWLKGLHVHVGSQGCPISLLLDGIGKIVDLAQEIEDALSHGGSRRVAFIDIGGGLPAAYSASAITTGLKEYAKLLNSRFPILFKDGIKLVTEFGRHIHANSGWTASKVEYIKRSGGMRIAIIHVGADMFLREAYHPDDWFHEFSVLDEYGNVKSGKTLKYAIAGPLCFAGDFIKREVNLPEIEEGDWIIIHDTGAYTFSMWSVYNSRQMPKIVGYKQENDYFEILRKRDSLNDIISFWNR